MNKLAEIRDKVHSEFLDLRCLDRYLRNPQFEAAYSAADDADRVNLEKQIKSRDLGRLRRIVKVILIDTADLGAIPVEDLRIKASEYGVTNYARLSKLELVAALRRKLKYVQKEKAVG